MPDTATKSVRSFRSGKSDKSDKSDKSQASTELSASADPKESFYFVVQLSGSNPDPVPVTDQQGNPFTFPTPQDSETFRDRLQSASLLPYSTCRYAVRYHNPHVKSS